MKDYELNLFVRVVNTRMDEENKTADEVLNDYPNLTDTEKSEIKNNL